MIDDYVRIPYTGVTPGSNALVVLFDSTTATQLSDRGQLRFYKFRRYVVSLKNSAPGVLRAYASADAGSTWKQFAQFDVAAAAPERNNAIGIPLEPHANVKVEFTSGVVAQDNTWYVAQALDDGEATFRSSVSDATANGSSSSFTTSQLPATLGQKTSAQSASVVEASDSKVTRAASLRACVRGEVLPITCGLTSKTFVVPAAWKGKHVRVQADGGDIFYQVSHSAGTPAVAAKDARAQETGNPIALTASASGNGCFKIPINTWIDIPVDAAAETFALQASADNCVARTHPAES